MQGALQVVAQNLGAALPNGLDQRRALVLKDMQASDGAQLEQKFRASQIGGTRRAIEMFHDFERNAHDPKMKMWAETALPALEKHLEAATPPRGSKRSSGVRPVQDVESRAPLLRSTTGS